MSVAVHHEQSGRADAPAMLLSASLGTSLDFWAPQIEAFADRWRVIRYDHRGHGRSPAPGGPYEIADLGADALALLDRLGVARSSFCGVSLGGMVGLWLAANAPQRIDRLVVICTSAHMPPAAAWAKRAATVRAAHATEPIADAVCARWLTPGFAAERPDLAEWLRAMLLGADAEGYAGCCEAIEAMDLRDSLSAISAPTLVIAGADDEATPPAHAELIAARIPGARLEILAPAAHLASVEQAAQVTRLIAEHVDPQESR